MKTYNNIAVLYNLSSMLQEIDDGTVTGFFLQVQSTKDGQNTIRYAWDNESKLGALYDEMANAVLLSRGTQEPVK